MAPNKYKYGKISRLFTYLNIMFSF